MYSFMFQAPTELPNLKNWTLSSRTTSRGYFPHEECPDLIQHVTLHLSDSLPKASLNRIQKNVERKPDTERNRETLKRIQRLMDQGYGSCVLRNPNCAKIVQTCLLHFHGIRYKIHAWALMPNHVHVLFSGTPAFSMQTILASWKKFTATRILEANHLSPRPLWHPEFHDRFIRNQGHYRNVVRYIHQNPVKAKLTQQPCDWAWSSASFWKDAGWGEEFGIW
jgi:type I restriction enzyme R subunit/putative DNA methylase